MTDAPSSSPSSMRFPLRALLIVVGIALIGRALLIASNTVSFHSDEAVVALMARHILQGERPTFFYGQAYMGSLDAWLVAVGFTLFGQTVTAIRLVQGAIYLGIVASGFGVAWSVTRNRVASAAAGLVLAIPCVLFATYTAATLGGYGETLLSGNLLLILGMSLAADPKRGRGRWLALGVIGGIGWWTNALIAVYMLPVIVVLLVVPLRAAPGESPLRTLRPVIGGGMIALLGFVIGAAPWWVFALQTDFAPLAFLTGSGAGSGFAGTDVFSLPLGQRLIGFFLIGLPTVIGVRFPWFPSYFAAPVGLIAAVVVLIALYRFFRRGGEVPGGRLLIRVLVIGFSGVYLASHFSFDPTGRYFLPLVLPAAVMIGALAAELWEQRRALAVIVVALLIGYQAAGQIVTATTYPGFTTQFNLDTHIPNGGDGALIAFLDAHGLYHGYTQYWISFRLAFLSGERMQYSAALPYLPSLSYTPKDERYPPYRTASDQADDIAYIIANTTPSVTPIRAWLETQFAARGVQYRSADVGVFTVYYDFAPAPPRPPLG